MDHPLRLLERACRQRARSIDDLCDETGLSARRVEGYVLLYFPHRFARIHRNGQMLFQSKTGTVGRKKPVECATTNSELECPACETVQPHHAMRGENRAVVKCQLCHSHFRAEVRTDGYTIRAANSACPTTLL